MPHELRFVHRALNCLYSTTCHSPLSDHWLATSTYIDSIHVTLWMPEVSPMTVQKAAMRAWELTYKRQDPPLYSHHISHLVEMFGEW